MGWKGQGARRKNLEGTWRNREECLVILGHATVFNNTGDVLMPLDGGDDLDGCNYDIVCKKVVSYTSFILPKWPMLMWRLESETIVWTHNCCWMGHPKQTTSFFVTWFRCTKQLANASLGWHDGHYKTHEVSTLFHNQKSEVFRHGWWGGSPSFFIIRWWYLVWKYVWADEFSQMFQQFFFCQGVLVDFCC